MPARPDRRRRWLAFVLVYLGLVLACGIRPRIPPLARQFYGSSAGAYNMFSATVQVKVECVLRAPGGKEFGINPWRYLWRNPLINTTHSHLDRAVLVRFVEFLAARPELRSRVPAGQRWEVAVNLRFRKDRGSPQELGASAPVESNRGAP